MHFKGIKLGAKRRFNSMNNYQNASNQTSLLNKQLNLDQDDELLGIYRNIENSLVNSFCVSCKGLFIYKNKVWQFIPYSSIKNINAIENKINVEGLYMQCGALGKIHLPIRGYRLERDRKFFDAFEFCTFLGLIIRTETARAGTGKNKDLNAL